MKKKNYLIYTMCLTANYCFAITINANLLNCLLDGDGFSNLCKIAPQNIYHSPLDTSVNVELDYQINYSWPCHDNFKGGIAIENRYADKDQKAYFDYNGSLLQLTGYGDLNFIDTDPSDTAKAILPPRCALTISSIKIGFSAKQTGIFKSNVCRINNLTQIKNDLSLTKTVSDSMADSMKRGMSNPEKLKLLNAIKESLSKQLWLKQDPIIQQKLLEIIGSPEQSGSLVYIIQNIQTLNNDDFETNINLVFAKLNNFFANANMLLQTTVNNIFATDSSTYNKLGAFSGADTLNSNISWVNGMFYDNDVASFIAPSYCN